MTATTAEITERYNEMGSMALFCFTRFSSHEFEVVEEERDKVIARLDLPQNQREAFTDTFGDTAVLLPNDFMDRLKAVSEDLGLEAIAGNVNIWIITILILPDRKNLKINHSTYYFGKIIFLKFNGKFAI
ncbi:hypothetical protein [Fictibacillus sp. NRS-1165]|uniref:hypothetical protein n=1 Tax=Fictibacillus sp. NRS-1165 TaxID=3144463 RepID=UPI003D19D2DE